MGRTGEVLTNQTKAKKEWQIVAVGCLLLLASGLLQGLARKTDWFGTWYVGTVYPWLVGSVGRVFGLLPFSAVEFLLYGLMAGMLIFGIIHIKKPFLVVSSSFLLISGLLFVYTCNCGVNYYAESFSSISGFALQASSTDELYELCLFLIEQAEANETTTTYHEHSAVWKAAGVAAMSALGERYESLDVFYPLPKEVSVSRILSVQQLAGVYSPFTIEANFNGDMPDDNIPHTICHELSHLSGFMREDEANFIGYLACIGSENQAFRYSGYLRGWAYAGNALAKVDYGRYMELYEGLSDQIKADLKDNSAFWMQFEGGLAEVSNQMNDTYLKINSQHDGVESYGRMVDLMLAYYRQPQA